MKEFVMIMASLAASNGWWLVFKYGNDFTDGGKFSVSFALMFLSIAIISRIAYLVALNWKD